MVELVKKKCVFGGLGVSMIEAVWRNTEMEVYTVINSRDETNDALRAARERLRTLDRKLERRWTENRDQQASLKARNGTVSEAVKEMNALHATRERLRAVNEMMNKQEMSFKEMEALCKCIEVEFIPMIDEKFQAQENVILTRINRALDRTSLSLCPNT